MSIQKASIICLVLLCGCAKSAVEKATEATLHQATAIEQQIKKECPQAQIEEPMKALRSMIDNQLASCESQMGQLKERNNTLLAILIGLVVVILAFNWAKIKTRIFK